MIGKAKNETLTEAFQGSLSCIQFFDQSMTVEEVKREPFEILLFNLSISQ